MVTGVPYTKLLTLAVLELAALYSLGELVRALILLVITWLFVVAFRHRHFGLDL